MSSRPRRSRPPTAASPVRKVKVAPNDAPPPDQHELPIPWVQLRGGANHPLIYQRMVACADPAARPGDIVAIYGKRGDFLGQGFYHDRSQIAVRLLTSEPETDEAVIFRTLLKRAIDWRQLVIDDPENTEAYRLVHAEGDGCSGLIAERYGDVIVIEVFSLGIYRRLDLICNLLEELTGITKFYCRADDRIERLEGFHLDRECNADVSSNITIRESGLRFRLDLQQGHKTGFFCDQRENRRQLTRFCNNADVLDVCCYTGGFSLYAKKLGNANQVTGVDLDEHAIAAAQKNSHLNEVRIKFVHADAFSYLRQMQTNQQTYDVVVVDPPKFVANRSEFDEGGRKYVDLNQLAMSVVRPSGLLLTCSCSGIVSRDDFQAMIKAAARRSRRTLQFVDVTGPGPDHPVMANCPESGYLKAFWARVM